MDKIYSDSLQWALNHFCVTKENLQQVLAAAMETGADYADIYFEHSFSNHLQLTDNKVDNAGSLIEFGAGVRVVSGDRTGYAYTEAVTLENLLHAARTANRIVSASTENQSINLSELPKFNRYPSVDDWQDTSLAKRRAYLEKLNDRVFSLDEKVKKVIVSQGDGESHILFVNSLGNLYYDFIPMAMLSVSCLMEKGNRKERCASSRSFRMGFEFLNDNLIEELAQEAVSRTAILFDAVKPKGGVMPVVMGAGGSGILLHEAIGHAFEADFNRLGTSIFSDKLGKQICNSGISVVDDGTIPFNRGAVNYDDEGVAGQKTYIVAGGRLNSYLHDRISAHHYGVNPTGNGRRESFRFTPMPRMRATYMENGENTVDEMIASVKNGVYVDVFSNGQVQIGAGDFTFYVKSGYLIENGRLTMPIKDINIIGNGPQALADISMVGNDLKIDNGTWTCGKNGQSCPVTCGMPSVLVDRLTVGGL